MNATELRIGNLFIEQSSKEIISVIGLEKNRVVFSRMFLDKWQAEPIPLTEQWVLKLGFVFDKFQYSCYFTRNQIKIKFNPYDLKNTFSFIFQGGEVDVMKYKQVELKYVHQLQNLYFSLTDIELTVA